jgi:hypothetical protein
MPFLGQVIAAVRVGAARSWVGSDSLSTVLPIDDVAPDQGFNSVVRSEVLDPSGGSGALKLRIERKNVSRAAVRTILLPER